MGEHNQSVYKALRCMGLLHSHSRIKPVELAQTFKRFTPWGRKASTCCPDELTKINEYNITIAPVPIVMQLSKYFLHLIDL